MASITLTSPLFYKAGKSGVTRVVGFESKVTRVVRYRFTAPATGASEIALAFSGISHSKGQAIALRYHITEGEQDYADPSPTDPYTGTLQEGQGSARLLLLPGKTYSLWVFPGAAVFGWYSWSAVTGTLTTGGGSHSTVSAKDGTLGSPIPITITAYAPFTHKLTWSLGSGSGNITGTTWTPPLSLAAWIPGQTATATLTCQTFDGDTCIGSHSIPVKLTVPQSLAPKLSVTWPDSILQHLTQAPLTVTAAAQYGASLVSTQVLIGGKAYPGGVLHTAGDLPLAVTATDSRGLSSAFTGTLTVTPYTAPQLTLTAHRCDETGAADDSGDYALITVTGSTDPLGGTPDCYITAADRTFHPDLPAGPFQASVQVAAPSESPLAISAGVRDAYLEASRSMILSVGYATLDFLAGGRGVALGKVAEEAGLDVAMDTTFRGALRVADAKGVLRELGLLMYPVGAVFISTSATSPAQIWGGTWERLKDRFLLAAGDTYAPGTTGGAATHTLTASEMPRHTHGPGTMDITGSFQLRHAYNGDMVFENTDGAFTATPNGGTQTWANGVSVAGKSAKIDQVTFSGKAGWSGATAPSGSGKAHSILPPYLALYMWQRTA